VKYLFLCCGEQFTNTTSFRLTGAFRVSSYHLAVEMYYKCLYPNQAERQPSFAFFYFLMGEGIQYTGV
jgi:hypothetical protein